MSLLFIGKRNLNNDAILEILRRERQVQIEQMRPEEFQAALSKNPRLGNNSYSCVIVDLGSFELPPIEVPSFIRGSLQTDRLVVIDKYSSEALTNPLLEEGADYYLNGNFSVEELLESLDRT